MNTGATPVAGQPFAVRGLSLVNGVTVESIGRRQNLLADLDRAFEQYGRG